jgi:hypothetical protein
VKVEIDDSAIVAELASKAARSKSGRATALGGLIVARRVKK